MNTKEREKEKKENNKIDLIYASIRGLKRVKKNILTFKKLYSLY